MANEAMPLVSVFTCVYNRADKIHRVFRSLMGQSYRKIEHIIIDDGSTDNIDEVCRAYMEQVNYPVIYRKKENGGKHTATNMAWDLATGEYIIQLDSDDELLPHAIEHLVQLWNAIPEDVRDQYWCVQGRCRTQHSDALLGLPNPEGINEMPLKEARVAVRKCGGERVGLMKRAILKDYRYPEPEAVTFVTESVLWFPLNQKYKTWYTNEVVRIYYVNEGDCLSKLKRNSQNMSNICWNSRWRLLNRRIYTGGGIENLVRYFVYYQFTTDAYKEKFPYYCVTFRQDWMAATALRAARWPLKLMKPVLAKVLHVV